MPVPIVSLKPASRSLKTTVGLAAIFLLAGCGGNVQSSVAPTNFAVTPETFAKIKHGMSGWEVSDLLGSGRVIYEKGRVVDKDGIREWESTPNSSSSRSSNSASTKNLEHSEDITKRVVWQHQNASIYVTFKNDSVIEKSESQVFSQPPAVESHE